MKKITYPLLFFPLLFCNIYNLQSQDKTPKLLSSTITSVSSTSNILQNNKVIVIQSIGQSGVIGTKKNNSTSIQQGFLNNAKHYKVDNSKNSDFEEILDLVISPNPFIDFIKIDFSAKTKKPVHIRIYDTNGKVFTYEKYPATEHLIVPMKNFAIGNYIVQIVSGKNKYVKKILKAK